MSSDDLMQSLAMKTRSIKSIAFLPLVLAMVGCASIPANQAHTTFYTQPPGALLYEGDTAWGMAPQKRIYTLTTGQTVIVSRPITAVWPSGAKVTTQVRMNPGVAQQYTFSRPLDAPGLDKDMAFANQLQQTAIAQQRADAASSMATAAIIKATQPPPPVYRPPVTTNCNSFGNATNCTSW